MSIIQLKNVSKTIKGNSILKNINLDLQQGKIYGFSGANGCGKSVLFRIISGLVVPTLGSVEVGGKNLYKPNRIMPDSIGVMIDGIGLYPYYNAEQNLDYLASIKKVIDEKEIKKVIARVGLDPNNKAIYSKYSLGMKQRLIIAQAIMEKPNIIIFDEPTNSLDDEGVTLFRQIVMQEKQRGATILISSHNSQDLKCLCDKIFFISGGEIVREV